jgi:hypothetical protein
MRTIQRLYAMMNLPMRIILVLLCVLTLSSCISSVILIGCGVAAMGMPANDPVTFSANISVKTATEIITDQVTYTCEVKERKCIGGNWKIAWEEQNIPSFNIQLSNKYHALITAPSCRLSADMVKSANYGYTEIITVFDSSTNKQVYRATAQNSDLKKYNFESLSVTVE